MSRERDFFRGTSWPITLKRRRRNLTSPSVIGQGAFYLLEVLILYLVRDAPALVVRCHSCAAQVLALQNFEEQNYYSMSRAIVDHPITVFSWEVDSRHNDPANLKD